MPVKRPARPRQTMDEDFSCEDQKIVWTMPIYTVSEANRRLYWRDRHERAKKQRETVGLLLLSRRDVIKSRGLPSKITFVRFGGHYLDPHDNLPGSMKAIVDEFCKFYGVDDGKTCPFSIAYGFGLGGKYYGVRVTLEYQGKQP